MRILTLDGKLTLLLMAVAMVAAGLAALLGGWLGDARLGGLLALLVLLLPLAWLARTVSRPVQRLLRALEGSVVSYRDGDFSVSLALRRNDELGQLVLAHNELGQALRQQRQNLAQRELLLDTVVQHTPTALLLVDAHRRVAYANIAARRLLNEGASLNGLDFDRVLDNGPETLREQVLAGQDSLFSVDMDGHEESFHLAQRAFRLQGRPHTLVLLRRMTRELSRQEVATWKKVIRLISHELNNSLAPISSLAHSGSELARRGERERLPAVFAGIGERARHLHTFISGYADFAKLPAPRAEPVTWKAFLGELSAHCHFRLLGEAPSVPGHFDRTQMVQVLINVLKNACESGGPEDEVALQILRSGKELRFQVLDRGSGMNENVLASALLPFYSTKRSGTGLGLALVREIVEAHAGRVALANRRGGGLCVELVLPQP